MSVRSVAQRNVDQGRRGASELRLLQNTRPRLEVSLVQSAAWPAYKTVYSPHWRLNFV